MLMKICMTCIIKTASHLTPTLNRIYHKMLARPEDAHDHDYLLNDHARALMTRQRSPRILHTLRTTCLTRTAAPADCTNVDVHYVGDENGYRVQYLFIHSLRPLPACLEDAHDHDDPLYDPATHDPPEESTGSPHNEDDLPDSHGEDHGEDHGPSDSHIDYNVTDSHTPYSHTHTDCQAPSDFHTPSDSHTPSDTHTPDSHFL
ncbi:uncharacterized protein LOC135105585 isoform X2 [Scylla paramamosain]|uniref:uncharacterized protein LOC135105585 isoform X2 n=1 Tax=Scylla paramamosain TaxID=85552 RepID=UPI0030832686